MLPFPSPIKCHGICEKIWHFLKDKDGHHCDPVIPLLGTYPQRTENRSLNKNLYMNAHSSTIHNSQKVGKKSSSIDAWINIMWDPHNGILFISKKEWSLKKGRSSGTWYNIDEPWKHYVEWKKPHQKDHNCMNTFIWNFQNSKSINTESRLVVAMGWREELETGVTDNRSRTPFWGDENVLEFDSGDGCTTLSIHMKINILYTSK